MRGGIIALAVAAAVLAGGCRQAGYEDEVIVQAIERAFQLERTLWDARATMDSLEDVQAHFSQRFADDLAETLAEHYWNAGSLRTGEPLFFVPSEIEVTTKRPGRAQALLHYDARAEGPTVWPEQTIRTTLVKRQGTWKISKANPVD